MTCQNVFDPNGGYVCTNVYTASGSNATFVYDFNYLNKENWALSSPNTADVAYNPYLTILINDIAQNYTMSDDDSLVLTSNPVAGAIVVIRRNSAIEAAGPKVTFQAGSVDPSLDQNKSARQMFYLAQELYDRTLDAQCQLAGIQGFINAYQFTANGSTNTFDLTNSSSTESNLLVADEILVMLNGAIQQARSSIYTMSLVAGVCRVTLVSTPINGTLVEVRTLSSAIPQSVTVADNSITNAKLAGGITFDKMNWSALGSNGQFLGKVAGSWGAVTITTANVSGLAAFVTAYKVTDLAAPTGTFSMAGFKIVNLGTPTANTDAATKLYVDTVASTTYAPSYKMAQVTVTSTIQTVSNNFAFDYVRLTIEGETVSGSTLASPVYSCSIPHSRTYTAAAIASTVAWVFRRAPSSAQAASIDVTASGTSITLKNTAFSYDNGTGHVITVEFFKNNPNA